jgi:two-component system LytT family response regulator
MIVDDEAIARERVRRLLAAEPDVTVVGECSSGPQAIADIDRLQPDVVFLDVQMPGCDGFEVLRSLHSGKLPVVVFVTAFDQYALQAFDVHALDYLLKPFDARRLRQSLDRARAQLSVSPNGYEARLAALIERVSEERTRLAEALARATPQYLERVSVRLDGRILFVRVSDIDWVESSHNYVRLHVGKEIYRLRESLSDMATRLDPSRFTRIHRFTIVNLDRIREVQPWFSGDYVVILQNGQRLRMSRSYRGALKLDQERLVRTS